MTLAIFLLITGFAMAQDAAPTTLEMNAAEKQFQESLNNVTLIGFFTQGDTAELRHENHQDDERNSDGNDAEKSEPESVAQAVNYRVLADRGVAAGHLHEKAQADHADDERPDQLITERRARLRGSRDRPYLEETANTCNDAETDLNDFFHCGSTDMAIQERWLSPGQFRCPSFARRVTYPSIYPMKRSRRRRSCESLQVRNTSIAQH